MINFYEFLKMMGAGAGVPYVGQSAGPVATWQGAAGGGKLKSVGPVKLSKSEKQGGKKKKKKKSKKKK